MLREAAPAEVAVGRRVESLRNATLFGRPGRWAIRVRRDRIASISAEDGTPVGVDELDAALLLVVPGFCDEHVHVLAAARHASAPRLDPATRGIEALAEAIAAAAHGGGGWVHVTGFDHDAMTGGAIPDRVALDAICATRPVRLQHRTLRLDVLNSEALRRCELVAGAGVELRDGMPTGRIFQNGGAIRDRFEPAPDPTANVARLSRELLRHGVTSIHDAGEANGPAELRLLDGLAETGVLLQRLRVMISAGALGLPTAADELRRTTHAKLTAVEARLEPEKLGEQARVARRAGLGVAIHATSEAELAAAVATIGAARELDPTPASLWTYRIEHASVASEEMLGAVAAAGAAVVANPAFIATAGDRLLADYPTEEHGWLHRLASWRRAGVPLALASDAPVTQSRPLEAIEAACSRRTPCGSLVGPGEKLDEAAALAAVTPGPLRIGGPADVVLLRSDAGRLRGAEVAGTVLGGALVFGGAE